MVRLNPLGYFVYADGMFRWDSIVPFAVPGTYQSDPGTLNTSQTQVTGLAQYSNTPDGLQEFLSELRAAAKSGDQAKVDSLTKQTEIPEYRNWFCGVYVPGSGLSWAIPCGNNLAQSEQAFKALWDKLAQDDGEIRVQRRVIHTRTSLDLYQADWKSKTGALDEWIGMFYYVDGMFRWNSTVRRVPVARMSPGGGVGAGVFRVLAESRRHAPSTRRTPSIPRRPARPSLKAHVCFR